MLIAINKIIENYRKLRSIAADIDVASKHCVKTINNRGKILFCGNGGSAADSQHLAAELIGKFLKIRKPIPALALTTNSSIITSIGNDIDFKMIFARQIEALGNKGDILFAITTSGKSKNILEAIKVAKKKNIKIILLTSLKCKLKKNNQIHLIKIPATRVDRIQEMHITVGHLICEYIENNISF
jgi:D-sedoheptulose 7-phosphate isomerase